MPVSLAILNEHISFWSGQHSGDSSRKAWSKYVFHTLDISALPAILADGCLRSRNEVVRSHGGVICDVANQGALWNNPDAHDYVRFYFRPKNSFHLKTEGIKEVGDRYRVDPHMSIPISIVFPIEEILARDDAFFVPGNFARTGAAPLSGDANFANLDFSRIYHDSAPPRHQMGEIHDARMSEVVVRGNVDLNLCRGVVVRSPVDRQTVKHMIDGSASAVRPKVLVDRDGAVFMKRGIALREIYAKEGHIVFKFNSPHQTSKTRYHVRFSQADRECNYTLDAYKLWRSEDHGLDLAKPVRCEIEGCLAYEAVLPSETTTVV